MTEAEHAVGTVLKAIPSLAKFAEWAIREGAWNGNSLDGGEVQDKATELGLLIETKYDPTIHGPHDEAEPGCSWFVFSPAMKNAIQMKV